jgi:hypothetical protein
MHNEELCNSFLLFTKYNYVRCSMRWQDHVTLMRRIRNSCKLLDHVGGARINVRIISKIS